MLTSVCFLLLLIPSLAIYYLINDKHRWKLLLLYSLVFVLNIGLIDTVVLALSICLCFFCAVWIAKKPSCNRLYTSIFLQLILLFGLKYGNLLSGSMLWIVPIGISFYSLQIIGYYIDVYRADLSPENSIGRLALYLSFFPKLVQGPIESAQGFIAQTYNAKVFKEENIRKGLLLLLFGLVKKLVIADRLAIMVGVVFDTHVAAGFATLMGVYLFTFQLYFDFSGYTDMARGVALLFAYDLSENFNSPLQSTSISDLWRRWHITLMQWLNQYVYQPIAFTVRDKGKIAITISVFSVFVISGIWHGLGFAFLIWSLLNAACVVFEFYTSHFRNKLKMHKWLSIVVTFNVFCFINVFFRSQNCTQAFVVISNLYKDWHFTVNGFNEVIIQLMQGGSQQDFFNFYSYIALLIGVLIFEKKLYRLIKEDQYFALLVVLFTITILGLGALSSHQNFIYRQF
jgi:alginate O-acetyltransferase complex protein AlgI